MVNQRFQCVGFKQWLGSSYCLLDYLIKTKWILNRNTLETMYVRACKRPGDKKTAIDKKTGILLFVLMTPSPDGVLPCRRLARL